MVSISFVGSATQNYYGNYQTEKSQKGPQIDTNGDSAISKDELNSFVSEMNEKTSQSVDSDELFSKLDTDGDGSVSEEESKSLKDLLPKPKGAPPQMGGMPPGGGGGKEMFSKIDTNGDSSISKDELSTMVSDISSKSETEIDSDELFSKLDTDEDGSISEEESKSLKDYLPKPPKMDVAKADDSSSSTSSSTSTDSTDDTEELIKLLKQKLETSYSNSTQDYTKSLGSMFNAAS